MKNAVVQIILFIIIALQLCRCSAESKEYWLFYLGGQSNMDGYGRVRELPEELNSPVKGVMIFHGNSAPDGTLVDGRGIWSELRPGHGVNYISDGKSSKYSNRFGVELTFARRLLELYKGANIAIIKYSRGGTSIDRAAAGPFGCWDPEYSGGKGAGRGINQYDHFLATVRNAMSIDDIDGDGEQDRLVPMGIVWMQGESDACFTREIALRYRANLKKLMDLIRAAFRMDDLPVVIGHISDSGRDKKKKGGNIWKHGNIIRAAQEDFVREDSCAALVFSTHNYNYSDPWHYNSAGYIDLGRKFADAIAGMHSQATSGESK